MPVRFPTIPTITIGIPGVAETPASGRRQRRRLRRKARRITRRLLRQLRYQALRLARTKANTGSSSPPVPMKIEAIPVAIDEFHQEAGQGIACDGHDFLVSIDTSLLKKYSMPEVNNTGIFRSNPAADMSTGSMIDNFLHNDKLYTIRQNNIGSWNLSDLSYNTGEEIGISPDQSFSAVCLSHRTDFDAIAGVRFESSGMNTIWIYRMSDGVEQTSITLSQDIDNAQGLTYIPSKGKYYVTEGGNIVYEVDPATGNVSTYFTFIGVSGIEGLSYDDAEDLLVHFDGSGTENKGVWKIREVPDDTYPQSDSGSVSLNITNDDAETGDMTGWTISRLGANQICTGTGGAYPYVNAPEPREGTYFFFGGQAQYNTQGQMFEVPYQARDAVDAGNASINIDYYTAGDPFGQDRSGVSVRFYDQYGNEISVVAETKSIGTGGVWDARNYNPSVPANTRSFVIEMQLIRYQGTYCNAFFDGMTATFDWNPISTINANGWEADYNTPGTFDPYSNPEVLQISRSGYDTAGDPTTVVDTLTIMSRVRQAYPNQASWTASKVALSDVIYSGDSIPGVTNNSTRSYPKPQAMWLNHDLDVARSSTYTVRLAVAHAHARNGRPVAAVRFSATDGTTTVYQTITSMTSSSYMASGLSVPCFEASMDISSLNTGALITFDAEIRPWVGDSFTISTDADTYPSAHLTVLKVLNDRDDSYGTSYAYVDPVLGNDGTGVASDTPATAAASPFATVPAAGTAIISYNNTNYGRNNLSGGIIRLEEGTTVHASFGWYAVGDIPLVIEAADAADKATTIFQDAGSSLSNGFPDLVKFKNITLQRSGGAYIFLDNNATLDGVNMMVAENCTFDANGASTPYGAWVYRPGRFWVINCDGDDCGQCRRFSSVYKASICVGSGAGSLQGHTYHAVGCKDLDSEVFDISTSGQEHEKGTMFFGWNYFSQATNGTRCLYIQEEIDDRGLAIVGNVFEQAGGVSAPILSISADSITETADNVNNMCNTIVGSRTNFLYNDIGSVAVNKTGRCRFNVDYLWNSKDDTFSPENGNRTGNWQVQYRVGFRGNTILEGSSGSDEFGQGNFWLGEIAAIGDITGSSGTPIDADWVDDQSFQASGSGDGDYRPGGSNGLANIEAGLAPYSVDQNGTTIPNDGTGLVGALQP